MRRKLFPLFLSVSTWHDTYIYICRTQLSSFLFQTTCFTYVYIVTIHIVNQVVQHIYIYIYLYIHMMCVYIYIHIPRHGSRISLPLPLVVCSHQRRPLMWWTTRISSTPSTGARQHSPCWKDQRWPTACVFFDFWVAKKIVFFGVFVFFDFRFFQTWTYCGWKKSCTSS